MTQIRQTNTDYLLICFDAKKMLVQFKKVSGNGIEVSTYRI